MSKNGYSESVTIVEKLPDHTSAVKSTIHFQANGDALFDNEQDMEPVLQHVQQMREMNDAKGGGWGEGRLVGHIPALYYPAIAAIKDRQQRDAAILKFFRDRPDLVGYSPYLRTPAPRASAPTSPIIRAA